MTTRNINCLYILLAIGIMLTITIQLTYSCNKQICASMVSKCMLTQSCKCDLKNCSCCKECFNCLSYLYNECCSCVEMCPKRNETRNSHSKESHVAELEGVPGLFKALTDESDDEEKWSVFTFPVDFDAALYGAKMDKDIKYYLNSADQELNAEIKGRENIVTYNCTVIYMSQCMSWNKCKQNCESMGATSYRWFHDGCCECVGSSCINYGINDSRCVQCPEHKDDGLEEIPNEDDLDFGEGTKAIEPVETNL